MNTIDDILIMIKSETILGNVSMYLDSERDTLGSTLQKLKGSTAYLLLTMCKNNKCKNLKYILAVIFTISQFCTMIYTISDP